MRKYTTADAKNEAAKSVFFVSLPKSGTVFTWYALTECAGLKMPAFHEMAGWAEYTMGLDFSCPQLYACGDYNTQLLRPENMHLYTSGHVFGAHMQASHHNIKVLKDAGIDKISVLLRDPRDALVSWVHHLASLGASARNYHSKIYHTPRAYFEWSHEKQIAFQIRTFLPTVANWIEGWLDYYASPDRDINVQFVYYDELRSDPTRYLGRIAQFHQLENVNYTKLRRPSPGALHFRKGEHDQWRSEFTVEDQRLAQELLGDRIIAGFAAAAASRLRASPTRGDKAVQADTLDIVANFPGQRAGYDALLADTSDPGISRLRDQVEYRFKQSTTEGQFICHADLVDICHQLVDRQVVAA